MSTRKPEKRENADGILSSDVCRSHLVNVIFLEKNNLWFVRERERNAHIRRKMCTNATPFSCL